MGNMGSRFHTNNLKAETKQPVEKAGSERYLMEQYKSPSRAGETNKCQRR